MSLRATYTPKEFADEILAGKRSAKWVRQQCRQWRASGRGGIRTSPVGHYLIPQSEAVRFTNPEAK